MRSVSHERVTISVSPMELKGTVMQGAVSSKQIPYFFALFLLLQKQSLTK